MSLSEDEQPRSRRALDHHNKQHKRRRLRKQHERQKHSGLVLDAPLSALHDDQVLTFLEWCRINRVSERTGRRILANGNGPVVTMLSTRRVGITIGNNRAWQASRARA